MADENTKSSDSIESCTATPGESSNCMDKLELPYGLETTKMCSPNISTPPRLKPSFLISTKTNETHGNVLTVSQINGNANLTKSTSPFILNPSKLNPFSKVSSNEDSKSNVKTDLTPKFLPLVQNGTKSDKKTEASENKPLQSTSQSNFVFGQNIQDRVVNDKSKCDTGDITNTNGTAETELLFTSAIKDASGISPKPNCSKSLTESAREYEEARAIKRKFEEVEILTGEEGETNILQISCKLFTYDKSGGGTWQERGRGVLRLNDQQICSENEHSHSRLVFRTAGSFRVILNTKIWADMTVQIASNKSIRFMALDNSGEIKVFLVMGSPDDIKKLHRHLEIRVNKEIEYQKHKDDDTTALTQPDRKKTAVTCEYE